MSIVEEGTVSFRCRHEHPDWTSNSAVYNFGTIEIQNLNFEATKQTSGDIELDIDGPLGVHRNILLPIPECDEMGLHVSISWKNSEIIVYLNGERAGTITL